MCIGRKLRRFGSWVAFSSQVVDVPCVKKSYSYQDSEFVSAWYFLSHSIGMYCLLVLLGSACFFPTIDTIFTQDSKVPKCKISDGVMKMDVTLFGEALTNSILEGVMAVAMTVGVVLVVGTSLTVLTALYTRGCHTSFENEGME